MGHLNFIIGRLILGIIAILSWTTNNEVVEPLYTTTEQTFTDTVPINHLGRIKFWQTFGDR